LHILLSFLLYYDPHTLHSFPTRRSSDLEAVTEAASARAAGNGAERYERTGEATGPRGVHVRALRHRGAPGRRVQRLYGELGHAEDRKSTRLNSSHVKISYAVFCLKKKKK